MEWEPKGLAEILTVNPDGVTEIDIIRMPAELAALADPVGPA